MARDTSPGTPQIAVPLLASTFLFFPLLQAFIQREFEVVMTLGMVVALWCLLVERRRAFAEEIRSAVRRIDAIDALAASRRAGLID